MSYNGGLLGGILPALVLSDLGGGEFDGDLDPTSAFMQGKLKVEGDMSVAMKLSSVL